MSLLDFLLVITVRIVLYNITHLYHLILLQSTDPSRNTNITEVHRNNIDLIGTIRRCVFHIVYIAHRMHRQAYSGVQVTDKPDVHGDIVTTVVPSIVRN